MVAAVPVASTPVPQGFLWVLRCMDVTSTESSSSPFWVAMNPGWIEMWHIDPSAWSAGNHFQWKGRQVLNAGQYIHANLPSQASFVASGYQLSVA